MVEMTCAKCGAVRNRPTGEVNRRLKAGKPLYCSRQCGNAARSDRAKPKSDLAWHKLRFTERANCIQSFCDECGRAMWLPPSKAGQYKRCSLVCNQAWRARLKKTVVVNDRAEILDRPCETCGKIFRPRPNLVRNGQGRFCCQACNTAGRAALAIAEDRKIEGIRRARANGEWTVLRGEANPNWKGGLAAQRNRKRTPEARARQAAALRKYRAENPDKVKEFSQRRAGRKLGRLPYGCLPKLRDSQGDKCAICKARLHGKGHLDHIMPLARGGKHAPCNIQFLCAPCNLRKSDRDPIDHANSIGMLL